MPPSREAEFSRDWLAEVPTRILVAKYACDRASVAATARRLGLNPRRRGGPSYDDENPVPLPEGEWRVVRGVRRWVAKRP